MASSYWVYEALSIFRYIIMSNESNFDKFKSALISLCKEHGMTITTSGYDGIEVWPLYDGREPLENYELENMTNFVNDLAVKTYEDTQT